MGEFTKHDLKELRAEIKCEECRGNGFIGDVPCVVCSAEGYHQPTPEQFVRLLNILINSESV